VLRLLVSALDQLALEILEDVGQRAIAMRHRERTLRMRSARLGRLQEGGQIFFLELLPSAKTSDCSIAFSSSAHVAGPRVAAQACHGAGPSDP